MEFGWLLRSGGDLLVGFAGVFSGLGVWTLVAVVSALVFAVWQVQRWRLRRRGELAALPRPMNANEIKSELRARFAEPSSFFADGASGTPTMGAAEAFEADIDAAARTVLKEARGRRTKAKELLRAHLHGGELNGSEAVYWRQLGALSLLDSTGDALVAYARAAELAPTDPEAQMLAGVLHMRAGNLVAAEAAFRRQISLGEGSTGSAVSYRGRTMLGDVRAASHAHGAAMEAYSQAQKEVLALLEVTPDHATLQRDLSVTCDRIGDMHLSSGELEAALQSYRNGLEIAQVLAGRDPANLVWQRDLSVSHDRVGDVLGQKGDWNGALASYRQGLAIAEDLAKRKSANLGRQWDLSASHDHIGDALLAMGRLDEALASYQRGLTIADGLVRRDPSHAGWQRDLAVSCHKIGSLEIDRGNVGEARELLQKGRAIISRLDRIAAHQAQWRADLLKFDAALRSLGG